MFLKTFFRLHTLSRTITLHFAVTTDHVCFGLPYMIICINFALCSRGITVHTNTGHSSVRYTGTVRCTVLRTFTDSIIMLVFLVHTVFPPAATTLNLASLATTTTPSAIGT